MARKTRNLRWNGIHDALKIAGVTVMLWLAIPANGTVLRAESLDQRQERIGQLSPDEKQHLLAKAERFRQLPAPEQERLRGLQARLEADPEADALRETLDRYHQWLLTIDVAQRAELSQLEPSQRIARIRQIMAERRGPPAFAQRPLSAQDREVVRQWIERQALGSLPADRREEYDRQGEDERRKWLVRYFMQRATPFDPSRRTAPLWSDLTALRDQLSETARDELQRADGQQKIGLITSWAIQAIGAAPSDDQLRQFFLRDLPPHEKQRLLAMPAEELQRELRRMYFRNTAREAGVRIDGFGKPQQPGTPPRGDLPPRNEIPRGPFKERLKGLPPPPSVKSGERTEN